MPLRQFRGKSSRASDLETWSMESASSTFSGSCVNAALRRRHHSVASTSVTMAPNPMRLARNAATAISFAALRTVVAPAARVHCRAGDPQRRKPLGIGRLERQAGDLGEIEPRRRPVDTVRPGQAMRDRHPHVGRRRVARSPSRRGIRPCHARSIADAPARRSASRQREQMMRLDQFEALVHHRRGVDRDLRAHRPVGMLAAPARALPRGSLRRPGAERPARRGQDDAAARPRAARRPAPGRSRCARSRPAARWRPLPARGA